MNLIVLQGDNLKFILVNSGLTCNLNYNLLLKMSENLNFITYHMGGLSNLWPNVLEILPQLNG